MNKFKKYLIDIPFRNKYINHALKLDYFVAVLIFLLSTLLLSAPMVMNKLKINYEDIHTTMLPNIDESISLFVESEDCSITDYKLTCNGFIDTKYGDYNYVYVENNSGQYDPEESTVYFSEEFIAYVHVFEDGSKNVVSGSYKLFNDTSFSDIETDATEQDITVEESTDNYTNKFIMYTYLSNQQNQIYFIIITNFFNYTILLIVFALLFQFVNFNQEVKKLNIKEAFKILVVGFLSVGMVIAFMSIFSPTIAATIINFVLIVRVVSMYFYIMSPKRDFKEKVL